MNSKYNGSEEQMKKYTLLMSAYGVEAGIDFKFHGTVANTLDAHRLLQHYQEEGGAVVADNIVKCNSEPFHPFSVLTIQQHCTSNILNKRNTPQRKRPCFKQLQPQPLIKQRPKLS